MTALSSLTCAFFAVGAMLLGLHILRELGGVREDYVHYAIYSMSGTIGLIIMIAALFNIYAINYQKSELLMTGAWPWQR